MNVLIAGYDTETGPELYWMDYMGSIQKVNFGTHGYVGYFVLSTLDRHYRPNMELHEAIELVKMCIGELKTRFIINQDKFTFKVVDASGVRNIEVNLSAPLPIAPAGPAAVQAL